MSMRNGASTVGAAVRSVLMQTLSDWEMIVIDNGSSDRSGDIVEGFKTGVFGSSANPVLPDWRRGSIRRWLSAEASSSPGWMPTIFAFRNVWPGRSLACVRNRGSICSACGAVVFTSEGKLDR